MKFNLITDCFEYKSYEDEWVCVLCHFSFCSGGRMGNDHKTMKNHMFIHLLDKLGVFDEG